MEIGVVVIIRENLRRPADSTAADRHQGGKPFNSIKELFNYIDPKNSFII